jgi:tetratricopeptide (TPR) repeat protein
MPLTFLQRTKAGRCTQSGLCGSRSLSQISYRSSPSIALIEARTVVRQSAVGTRRINSGRSHGHNLAIDYINRGFEYHAKGDNDRAIADYNQAIQLDPKFADAYDNRGLAYADKGDDDRAIADYRIAFRGKPLKPVTQAVRRRARCGPMRSKKA